MWFRNFGYIQRHIGTKIENDAPIPIPSADWRIMDCSILRPLTVAVNTAEVPWSWRPHMALGQGHGALDAKIRMRACIYHACYGRGYEALFERHLQRSAATAHSR